MADLRAQLESTLGGAYAIERELGGGGMARVFLATEHALARRVVIKVLTPELAAEVSAKRFAREIRLAASLQQANIVPVLSAGELDGMPYYVMPFVDGLSLREKLERDPGGAISQTVGIFRDVARALAYAHERGIVHRDIKPENILLSGDAAVVTDFGVAKAIASATLGEADENRPRAQSTVTRVGTAVGTPEYMSPEQIAADPTLDHRADIYSLGCVGYELLTGTAPFRARSMQALFAAHLTERPAPIASRNPDVPDALASLVMRCLEKDAGRRPQSAREILTELTGIPTIESSIARFTRRLSPRQRRATAIGGTLALSVLAATLVIRGMTATPALASVAVVPFLNVGGDSAQEYLADGMADELATALGKVQGIRVASRSLGYRYKGQRGLDAADIGRALSVKHVLHGSVRRVGNQLRVSAQLTSAKDNSEIWSESYDRNASQAFAVQEEITREIVAALGVSPSASAAGKGTSDPEAYDLYLRGRFLLQRRGSGVAQAIEKFEAAIARDSGFALAHASLALALELLPYFEAVNARTVGPRAISAAHRALAIDSTIAEAHTALGMAHQHVYAWARAEDSFRLALRYNPNEADAHLQYGRFLWYTGRVARAEPLFKRARDLDPYLAVASGWYGHLLFLRGEQSDGLAEMRRAVEIDSTNPPAMVFLADALRRLGRTDEARVLAQRLWRTVPTWRGVTANLDEPEQVQEMIRLWEQRIGQLSHRVHTSRATPRQPRRQHSIPRRAGTGCKLRRDLAYVLLAQRPAFRFRPAQRALRGHRAQRGTRRGHLYLNDRWEGTVKRLAILAVLLASVAQAQSARGATGRINVGDAMLTYASTGAGRPIVFIHGYAQHLGIWDDQVAAFAPRYRVIRYDVRGFGESSGHADPTANPEDLRLLLDGLGIRKAHIVGLSMGADIALRFAVLFPDRVDGLVLYGPPPTPDAPQPTELFELFSKLPDLAKTHGLDTVGKLIIESPLAWMPPDRPELKQALYREWQKYEGRDLLDPRPPSGRTPDIDLRRVSGIRTPTLVVHGDHEIPTFRAFADTLVRRIPNARKVVITDGGHGAHFAQPEQFNQALRAFFQSLDK